MTKFTETIGQLRQRQIKGDIHPPCRSYRELSEYICKKYGVTDAYLRGCLRRPDAPKPKVRHKSTGAGQNTWYEPKEFVKWFARVMNDEPRA